jgi:hypothetical protein
MHKISGWKERIPKSFWQRVNIYLGLLKVSKAGKKGSYIAQSIYMIR